MTSHNAPSCFYGEKEVKQPSPRTTPAKAANADQQITFVTMQFSIYTIANHKSSPIGQLRNTREGEG